MSVYRTIGPLVGVCSSVYQPCIFFYRMEFPYPSEDLHGITFGYDNIIEFPYAVEDLKGVTFGFDVS